MDINKPMTLLLIEDDVSECIAYKASAQNRDDVRFVGMTSSSIEGLKYVETYVPEGVILDLELHKGVGSGIEFLASLRETKLDFRPLVFVITNSSSEVVYNHAHNQGADLVYYKKQADYSAEMVINTLITLRKSLHDKNRLGLPKELVTAETPEERRARISDKINRELDIIGIGTHLTGRKYIFDSIYYLLQEDQQKGNTGSVFNNLANRYKRSLSSISRAMQTAINTAWRTSRIEDLKVHYTARVNYDTGVPTPTEFVYHYADKLKKVL